MFLRFEDRVLSTCICIQILQDFSTLKPPLPRWIQFKTTLTTVGPCWFLWDRKACKWNTRHSRVCFAVSVQIPEIKWACLSSLASLVPSGASDRIWGICASVYKSTHMPLHFVEQLSINSFISIFIYFLDTNICGKVFYTNL